MQWRGIFHFHFLDFFSAESPSERWGDPKEERGGGEEGSERRNRPDAWVRLPGYMPGEGSRSGDGDGDDGDDDVDGDDGDDGEGSHSGGGDG